MRLLLLLLMRLLLMSLLALLLLMLLLLLLLLLWLLVLLLLSLLLLHLLLLWLLVLLLLILLLQSRRRGGLWHLVPSITLVETLIGEVPSIMLVETLIGEVPSITLVETLIVERALCKTRDASWEVSAAKPGQWDNLCVPLGFKLGHGKISPRGRCGWKPNFPRFSFKIANPCTRQWRMLLLVTGCSGQCALHRREPAGKTRSKPK